MHRVHSFVKKSIVYISPINKNLGTLILFKPIPSWCPMNWLARTGARGDPILTPIDLFMKRALKNIVSLFCVYISSWIQSFSFVVVVTSSLYCLFHSLRKKKLCSRFKMVAQLFWTKRSRVNKFKIRNSYEIWKICSVFAVFTPISQCCLQYYFDLCIT